MNFTVYYADGVAFRGDNLRRWTQAPNDEVLGVVVFYGLDEHGRRLGQIMIGSDWYGFDGRVFYQGAPSGPTRGTWRAPDVAGAPKRGVWVDDATFERARAAMTRQFART